MAIVLAVGEIEEIQKKLKKHRRIYRKHDFQFSGNIFFIAKAGAHRAAVLVKICGKLSGAFLGKVLTY